MGNRQQVVSAETIKAALARHMRLSALDIKVETKGDTVFLSGVVDVLAEKLFAEDIVRRVSGVRKVENGLTIAQDGTISDKDIEAEVSASIQKEPRLASVGVKVDKGIVHLEGKVETLADEDLARRLAAKVRGVRDVVSRLQVNAEHPVDDATITNRVETAFSRDRRVNADAIFTRTERGVVYLNGWVETTQMKEAATRIASGVEGVREVVNNLLVEEEQTEGDVYLTNVIRQAVAHSPDVGLQQVGVFVVQGWAYLTGEVDSIDQKEVAEEIVRQINDNIGGIVGLSNDITVRVH